MSTQRHVILRQTVELGIAHREEAWTLQQEVSHIMGKVQPLIERCCDELSSPDCLHRIERLELDLGDLDSSRLEEELLNKFSAALRQGLSEQIKQQESSRISPAIVSQLELFEQFVRQGSLPWWANFAQTTLPEESLDLLLRDASDLLTRLLPELVRDAIALQRLIAYFDNQRLAALIYSQRPDLVDLPLSWFEAFNLLHKTLSNLSTMPASQFRHQLWQNLLINACLSAQTPANWLNFSRIVLMRLARLHAISYVELLQEIVAAEQISESISEIAKTLAQERTNTDKLILLQSLTEALPAAVREQLFSQIGSNFSDAIWAELLIWLDQSRQNPMPAGLQTGSLSLPEEFFIHIEKIYQQLKENFHFGADKQEDSADFLVRFGQIQTYEKSNESLHWEKNNPQANLNNIDALYLNNAGLVILWAFVESLFEQQGLLEKQRFIDTAAQQRGVALLQYLATEDATPPEYLLPLNKLLCGMELDSVFHLDTPLTATEQEQCNTFLEAVIEQAPILNKMSIAGFRGSFLLRQGMLTLRDGAWLLRVERETYDIVLDRFPWGMDWIKLPWMSVALRVEW